MKRAVYCNGASRAYLTSPDTFQALPCERRSRIQHSKGSPHFYRENPQTRIGAACVRSVGRKSFVFFSAQFEFLGKMPNNAGVTFTLNFANVATRTISPRSTISAV